MTRTRRARLERRTRTAASAAERLRFAARWTSRRVPLPPDVRSPFTVYVNGVRQELGADYEVADGALVFARPLVKEGRLGFWKWFWGAFGIGTLRPQRRGRRRLGRADGTPRVAHALEIEPPDA